MNWKPVWALISSFAFMSLLTAQNTLPEISVQNFSGKILVSWLNDFVKPVSNIFIQRSYDSLKNYSTIGTVLNPQNKENGYSDVSAPYTRMFYRVSISFENGEYIISKPTRPIKEISSDINSSPQYAWQATTSRDTLITISSAKKDDITYPSERVFTSRENNVVIFLKDAQNRKYSLRFYDDKDSLVFELNKLTEERLILEKVNFVRSGWFHFDLLENGKLIEKNKFLITKETKLN